MAITGLGMVTPVGHHAAAACAALRAGVSRLAELPLDGVMIDAGDGEFEVPVGAFIPQLNADCQGVSRLAKLAGEAAREALDDAGISPASSTKLWLGLPTFPWAGRTLDHRPRIAKQLAETLGTLDLELVDSGRAAALEGLRRAALALEQQPEGAVIVGGVDCWSDRLAVLYLRDHKRLRQDGKASGVLPGEGAAFVVLEREDAARARGARIYAWLEAAAGQRDETPPGDPCQAVAQTEVLSFVASHLSVPTALLVSDLNGERNRAFEWMFAFCRGVIPHARDMRHWLPAEAIGDAGAAAGAVALAWTAMALHRGYASEGQALVWGASDEGAREALLLCDARKS